MPALEEAGLYQRAVLWAATGTFDPDGNPILDSPRVVACRWKFTRRASVAPNGDPIAIDAVAVVKERVPEQSNLWLSTLGPEYTDEEVLGDWYGVGSAGQTTDVMYVEAYHETPALKGPWVKRSVELRRHRDDPGSDDQ